MAIEFITTEEHMQPITREEKFLAKAAGMDVGTLKPITRKEMFLSQLSGSGNGGGSGADLLEERVSEVLPETAVGLTEGMSGLPNILDLTEGETCTVTWNGTEYTCVAQSVSDGGFTGIVLGNIGVMMGGVDTGEPFILGAFPAELVEQIGMGVSITALDGSESVTLSIVGTTMKIKPQYLPDGIDNILVVNVNIPIEEIENETFNIADVSDKSYEEMETAVKAGKIVVVNFNITNDLGKAIAVSSFTMNEWSSLNDEIIFSNFSASSNILTVMSYIFEKESGLLRVSHMAFSPAEQG